ncbi:MAG: hypothetical protein LBT40_03540 [Deltaproteobacteria bacterium]|jgi:hypothetical protein|nr:hypothetical protein [Deltaproteobacteria bacterium]
MPVEDLNIAESQQDPGSPVAFGTILLTDLTNRMGKVEVGIGRLEVALSKTVTKDEMEAANKSLKESLKEDLEKVMEKGFTALNKLIDDSIRFYFVLTSIVAAILAAGLTFVLPLLFKS